MTSQAIPHGGEAQRAPRADELDHIGGETQARRSSLPLRPPLTPDGLLALSRRAAAILDGVAHHTPVMRCRALDRYTDQALHLKCENLQRGGAFKFRGATFAATWLSADGATGDLVTHSSGNHAQALALAAAELGLRAHVVMPTNAPQVKRRAVIGYGARVIPCPPTLEDREQTAAAVVEETRGVLIPPYDHPLVIAGQGTVGLELLQQVRDLEIVVVPLGGGGLLSGVALTLAALAPMVKVVGAEPEGADDAARSRVAGVRLPMVAPDTVADGLRTSLGEWTWPVVQGGVDAVITVPDDAIVEAMRLLWERAKLVVEPSGAIGVAVARSDAFRSRYGVGRRVGVVLSGGNVDLDALPWTPK